MPGGNFNGGFIGSGSNDAPIMFYSRRIGLNEGREVPLHVGGRLTGRAGKYSVGLLNIQTGEEEQTGARRHQLQRRSPQARRAPAEQRRSPVHESVRCRRSEPAAIGRMASMARSRFFENLQINTYWARTDTDGLSTRDNTSYRGQLDYSGDRYTVQIERLKIGDNFNPEMGFLRRDDMVRDYARFRFSPRPRNRSAIRKYVYDGSIDYIENGAGRLESRERAGEFALEFQNADRFSVNYTNAFEFLPAPFPIGGDVVLPVGGYQFDTFRVGYNLASSASCRQTSPRNSAPSTTATRRRSARRAGGCRSRISFPWSRRIRSITSRSCRDEFTTHLAGSRVTYSMTPADVRERVAAVQLGDRTPSRPTRGSGGSTGRAASCSSCTTTNATR